MKHIITSCLISIFFISCNLGDKPKEKFYSFSKSFYDNSYGGFYFYMEWPGEYYFYRFQNYIASVRKDSILLGHYTHNFEDSIIFNFLRKIYLEKGYDHSIALLDRVGELNSKNYTDSTIVVLDIYDDISLLCLSPDFATYALGSCCSPYQNFLIQKSKDSIIILFELQMAELLGVYYNNSDQISGLLFQGYSRINGVFKALNGPYNFRYNVNELGLYCNKIENVRRGEPFDASDEYRKLSGYAIPDIRFDKRHRLKTAPSQ